MINTKILILQYLALIQAFKITISILLSIVLKKSLTSINKIALT